jgi:hypothetical protein
MQSIDLVLLLIAVFCLFGLNALALGEPIHQRNYVPDKSRTPKATT